MTTWTNQQGAIGATPLFLQDQRPFYIYNDHSQEWYGPFSDERAARGWAEKRRMHNFMVTGAIPSGLKVKTLPDMEPIGHRPDVERAESYRLDSLIIHKHSTICQRCHSRTEHSQVFEVWCLPTPKGSTRRLVPATHLHHALPITIAEVKPESIPVCHECFTDLPVAAKSPITENAWRETLRRKYSESPKPVPVAQKSHSKASPIPSLDDL